SWYVLIGQHSGVGTVIVWRRHLQAQWEYERFRCVGPQPRLDTIALRAFSISTPTGKLGLVVTRRCVNLGSGVQILLPEGKLRALALWDHCASHRGLVGSVCKQGSVCCMLNHKMKYWFLALALLSPSAFAGTITVLKLWGSPFSFVVGNRALTLLP